VRVEGVLNIFVWKNPRKLYKISIEWGWGGVAPKNTLGHALASNTLSHLKIQ